MVVHVYGTASLKAFTCGIGVLVFILPSIFSSTYRDIVTAWWLYILTLYVPLAIVFTSAVFKDYKFKVNSGNILVMIFSSVATQSPILIV